MFTPYKRPRLRKTAVKKTTSGGWATSANAAKVWGKYKPKKAVR